MERHGMRRTVEYRTWCRIIQRCENPNCDVYEYYGGRGIKLHPEWRRSFAAFFQHLGKRPSPKHSVDRIDPDGNYEPGNVRWATWMEQRANRRPGARVSMYWLGKQNPAVQGERNSKAKLTAAKVVEIRRLYAIGGVTLAQMGERFGVTKTAVHDAVARRTWKHVASETQGVGV